MAGMWTGQMIVPIDNKTNIQLLIEQGYKQVQQLTNGKLTVYRAPINTNTSIEVVMNESQDSIEDIYIGIQRLDSSKINSINKLNCLINAINGM